MLLFFFFSLLFFSYASTKIKCQKKERRNKKKNDQVYQEAMLPKTKERRSEEKNQVNNPCHLVSFSFARSGEMEDEFISTFNTESGSDVQG